MDLYQYLQSAKSSLFRLEALQEFNVSGDEIDSEEMQAWWKFISEKTSSGVLMQRVRLIIDPMTAYIKNELIAHRKSTTFGADVRVISGDVFDKLGVRAEDFWLIDDQIVLKMKYTTTGEYLGFEVDEVCASRYVETKKLLLESSTPL